MYAAAIKKREEEELIKKFKQEPFQCMKHGRQGNPHLRQFFLSKNADKISWRNPTKKVNEGEINVADLKHFLPGCETPVFKRQAKKFLEENKDKCFSVVTDQRSLDLEFPTVEKKLEWEKTFQYLVEIGKALKGITQKSKEEEMLDKVMPVLKKWNFDVNSEEWRISKVLNKGESPTNEEIDLISCVWEKNSVVKLIDFNGCAITDQGVGSICKYIKSSTNLIHIDLSNNKISDQGINKFADILDVSHLKVINLSQNNIGDSFMKQLGQSLQKNLYLEELILDKNQISDDGIFGMIDYISENKTLKLLSLNENKLEGKGAKTLTALMKKTGMNCRIAKNQMVKFQLETVKPSLTDGSLEINLFLAVEQMDFCSVVSLLLDGANPMVQNDQDGKTAIHTAAMKGDIPILEFLLDHPKADINVKDDYDNTPIVSAMSEGKNKIVQYLLDRGADHKIANKDKKSLLHICGEKGNKLLVKHLIEKLNDDLSLCTNNKETILHFAAANQHLDVVKYLIEREQMERKALMKNESGTESDPTAFVNWSDVNGDTALHKVFKNQKVDIEVAKALVALGGADISLENSKKETALQNASDQVKSTLLMEARKFSSKK